MAAVPSCALMFKQEIPLMFPDCADTQLVKEHMWDPFEYFMARKRDGLLKTEFPQQLGNVSYQIPCHGRVQNIGKKTVLAIGGILSVKLIQDISGTVGK
jgi:Fe-S oxidoreductase